MTGRRWRSLLALWLFVVGTLGAPSLDAWAFHGDAHHHVAHVESADADCHGERCVLGTTSTPVVPVDSPAVTGRLEAAPRPSRTAAPHLPLQDRAPRTALGSRAPPARA